MTQQCQLWVDVPVPVTINRGKIDLINKLPNAPFGLWLRQPHWRYPYPLQSTVVIVTIVILTISHRVGSRESSNAILETWRSQAIAAYMMKSSHYKRNKKIPHKNLSYTNEHENVLLSWWWEQRSFFGFFVSFFKTNVLNSKWTRAIYHLVNLLQFSMSSTLLRMSNI